MWAFTQVVWAFTIHNPILPTQLSLIIWLSNIIQKSIRFKYDDQKLGGFSSEQYHNNTKYREPFQESVAYVYKTDGLTKGGEIIWL